MPESSVGGVADLVVYSDVLVEAPATVPGPLGAVMEPESGAGGAADMEIGSDVPVVVMLPWLGTGEGPGCAAASAFGADSPSQPKAAQMEPVVCNSTWSEVFAPRAAAGGKGFVVSAGGNYVGSGGSAGEAPRSAGMASVLATATAAATVERRSARKAMEQGVVAATVPGVQSLPPSAGKPSAVDPVLEFGNWLGVDQYGLGLCAPTAGACPVNLPNYLICSGGWRRRLMTLFCYRIPQ